MIYGASSLSPASVPGSLKLMTIKRVRSSRLSFPNQGRPKQTRQTYFPVMIQIIPFVDQRWLMWRLELSRAADSSCLTDLSASFMAVKP